VSDLLEYQAIQKLFGEKWLYDPKNKNHPLFTHGDETYILNSLNEYLDFIGKIRKRTIGHLKNKYGTQFWDTYSELEVAYFLKKHGLEPRLDEPICGKEPDIFLEEEELVIEVKNLHIPQKINESAKRLIPNSKVHDTPNGFDTSMHIERMLSSLEQKFQNIYPNIVCFCPETSSEKLTGNCDDLKGLIERHRISEKVSALAIWRQKRIECLFENPYGKKIKWESSELKRFFSMT